MTQQTPDLKTVVQEIIGHPGWQSGNPLTFLINGTGTRNAYSFERSPAHAPLLVIEYSH